MLHTDYSTSNYPPDNDSTSSGGSGSPHDAWSTPAQRGRHLPPHLAASTDSQSAAPTASSDIFSPTPYTPAFLPTPHTANTSASFYSSPSTPVISGYADQAKPKPEVPDSLESRREAFEVLTRRYRDSIEGKDR